MMELESLKKRLEKVERENRRTKLVGCLGALVAASLLLMGQARPSRVVTAQKFIVVDDRGNVKVELGMSGDIPHLWLYGAGQNNTKVSVTAGDWGGLAIYDASGARALLESTADGAILNLYSADGKSQAHLGVGTFDAKGLSGPIARTLTPAAREMLVLYRDVPGPSFEVSDGDGFKAVTGSTNLLTPETGESHRTSAASIMLFRKDGTVLWSAP